MPRISHVDTDFLKTARERFKHADDADGPQSKRERDDLAFYAGDQWPADIKLARQGQAPLNGMPAVPARPTLVINKVREPVRQVQNQIRGSDIGIELVPADDFGDLGITPDETEVTLREGLIRRIQRESDAEDARNWAGDRAGIAGRGYYLVMTRYLPGKTNDQDIYLHRIYNQAGVLLDPSHEQPDGSDADWGFVGTWVPWDRFKAEYPELADGSRNTFTEASESEFMAMSEDFPDWYKSDGDERAVRVVDYWYTERESRELATLDDGSAVWADEVPGGVTLKDTRSVVEKKIKWCKIGGGVLELDKTDWAGPDMPIVKVLGEELHPYDGERRAEGMVRPARDSQMGFNYMASKEVEVVGLSPIPLLQLDPEAIDGYEAWYNVINTRTLPWAPYRTYNDEGKELRAPHRLAVDPNLLAIATSLQMFDAAIKSTTAVPDPTLGNVDPSLKSGKAIQAVVANAAQSTSNFLENRVRSTRREGIIINNLLYPIYGARPGRMVRILTGEGENQAMVIDDPQQQAQQQRAQKVGKLTKDAHFNVIVKVTKSVESRRTQEATALAQLLSANPELMAWFGDLYFKNSDTPGRQALADRAKVMLAPPIQKMLAEQEQGTEPLPPHVEAQLAQMAGQIKMAEQAMGELNKVIEQKQIESQAKFETEKMKGEISLEQSRVEAQRDVELARGKNATAIRVAEIGAETKGIVTDHTLAHEADALHRTQAHETAASDRQQSHESAEAERTRQHVTEQAQSGMAHEAAMGAGDQDFTAGQADADRQAQADLAAQQAQTQEPAE